MRGRKVSKRKRIWGSVHRLNLLTLTEIHSHLARTIRRLVKLLVFVAFDGNFKINIIMRHKTNLRGTFEGQWQNYSTKVPFKVKSAGIFHALGGLSSQL